MLKRGVVIPGMAIVLMAFYPPQVKAQPIFEEEDLTKFGYLAQGAIEQCRDKGIPFTCGPVAAVNSLFFLQKQFPDVYEGKLVENADLVGTAKILVELMGCCEPKGTSRENFEKGLRKYLDMKAPDTTSVVTKKAPNISWLADELRHDENVELEFVFFAMIDRKTTVVGSHMVTLTGVNFSMDKNNGTLSFIDPTTGEGQGAKIASRTKDGDLFSDFGKGDTIEFKGKEVTIVGSKLNFAVSESPELPEPSTLLLLGSGLVGLAGVAWRRHRQR